MIVAYGRGDGAATDDEIAWVTVALQHLRVGDDSWARIDPVRRWLRPYGSAGAARAHGGAHIPARLRGLAAGQGIRRAGRNVTEEIRTHVRIMLENPHPGRYTGEVGRSPDSLHSLRARLSAGPSCIYRKSRAHRVVWPPSAGNQQFW